MLRGAKKKKGEAASTEPESNDLINIFKDRTDPVSSYTSPPRLIETLGNKTFGRVSNVAYRVPHSREER